MGGGRGWRVAGKCKVTAGLGALSKSIKLAAGPGSGKSVLIYPLECRRRHVHLNSLVEQLFFS